MDLPTVALIVVGLIFVGTVMAAGGIRRLIPPKAPAWGPVQTSPRPKSGPRPAADDPADNFFSDEDDLAFREPDANRGPFSQREEDRDSLDDPDRNR